MATEAGSRLTSERQSANPGAASNKSGEYFSVYLGDLPESLKEELRAAVTCFAVPLLLDEEFIGSGVLIEVDGHYGILTAAHVLNAPFRKSFADASEFFISVASFANRVSVSTRYLDLFTTARLSDEYGPDLGFILLPPTSSVVSEAKARKSFYNLANDPGNRMGSALKNEGFVAFVGLVAEEQKELQPTLGFKSVTGLFGYAFLTGVEKAFEKDSHDYLEVAADRSLCPTVPKSFGGVSGGGLWRFFVSRQAADDKPGLERLNGYVLAGITFYQIDPSSARPLVRAHGPRSIYQTFLSELRCWLREPR